MIPHNSVGAPRRRLPPCFGAASALVLSVLAAALLTATPALAQASASERPTLGQVIQVIRAAIGITAPSKIVSWADVSPAWADGTRGDGWVRLDDAVALLRWSLGIDPMPSDSSPVRQWREVDSVPGGIVAVDATHILYVEASGGQAALKVRDRGKGLDQIVETVAEGDAPVYGCLTPAGALWVAPKVPHVGMDFDVYEWRGGQVRSLGTLADPSSMVVSGGRALWAVKGGWELLDLATGQSSVVAVSTGSGADLSESGTLVYASDADHRVYRSVGGVATAISEGAYVSEYPLTDGTLVAYRQRTSGPEEPYRVVVWAPGGEVFHTDWEAVAPSPGLSYQVLQGWVAYSVPGATGALAAWLKPPVEQGFRQLSPFGEDRQIVAMAPNGEVALYRGLRVVLTRRSPQETEFGSNAAWYFWRDGYWYKAERGVLSRFEP